MTDTLLDELADTPIYDVVGTPERIAAIRANLQLRELCAAFSVLTRTISELYWSSFEPLVRALTYEPETFDPATILATRERTGRLLDPLF